MCGSQREVSVVSGKSSRAGVPRAVQHQHLPTRSEPTHAPTVKAKRFNHAGRSRGCVTTGAGNISTCSARCQGSTFPEEEHAAPYL